MLNSSKLAHNFDDIYIPPLPGIEDENHIRALLALHMEKTAFSSSTEEYEKNKIKIFDDFNIKDAEIKDSLLKDFDEYEYILGAVITRMQTRAKEFNASGRFKYSQSNMISFNKEDDTWVVDLKRLQEYEAKFDNVNLFVGQVIIVFNPKKPDKYLTIDNTGMDVREEGGVSVGMSLSSMLGLEEEKEEGQPDYKEWDKLLQSCGDRDIISVFQDGEEILRF